MDDKLIVTIYYLFIFLSYLILSYLSVETLGGWHPEAEKQIARIGRELARSTAGTDQKTTSNHLFQRLSLALQKGNAALILSRSTDVLHPDVVGSWF